MVLSYLLDIFETKEAIEFHRLGGEQALKDQVSCPLDAMVDLGREQLECTKWHVLSRGETRTRTVRRCKALRDLPNE